MNERQCNSREDIGECIPQDETGLEIVTYFLGEVGRCRSHGSHLSWDHCYQFFRGNGVRDHDLAALNLAFFLASWGMYRGRARIRNYDYKIHSGAIQIIQDVNIGCVYKISDFSDKNIDAIIGLYENLCGYYSEKVGAVETLVTKIQLGAIGCSPAYDTYLKGGLKKNGLPQSFSKNSFKTIINYVRKTKKIERAQCELENKGFRYPIMRVFDIYCHSVSRGQP